MGTGLFLGLTTVDILYGVDAHPSPNEKRMAAWQLAFAGGPAANASVTFSALGNTSHLCSGLGDHPSAQLAVKDLASYGVRFHERSADPDKAPVLSSILINSVTGDRCVIYSPAAERHLHEKNDCLELLNNCQLLLLDGHYLPQALELAELAHERGVKVVMDGGSWKDNLESLLPFVDYAICSENFLPPGCTDVASVLTYLSRYKMSGCAVSRGGNPIVACEGGEICSLQVNHVETVDTLGAGDILHGAFCHAILSNPFLHSLEWAAALASESCRYIGARQWIHEDTIDRMTR